MIYFMGFLGFIKILFGKNPIRQNPNHQRLMKLQLNKDWKSLNITFIS